MRQSGGPKARRNPASSLLSTKGELAITFVGTGSAFSKRLYQTNILVAKGDVHILVDCGNRATQGLAELGLSVTDIERCFITHTHADHIGGLEELMLVNRYSAKRKTKLIITDPLKRILWDQSLRGGAAWNELRRGKPLTFGDYWEQERPRRLRGADRELSTITVGDLELHIFRTKHIPDSAAGWADSFPSYGLVLDRKVLYTGDTRFDPGLLEWAGRLFPIERIFHDVQFFTGGVHASLDELATLAGTTKARTLLMHYGDKGMEAKERVLSLGFAGMAEQGKTYRFD